MPKKKEKIEDVIRVEKGFEQDHSPSELFFSDQCILTHWKGNFYFDFRQEIPIYDIETKSYIYHIQHRILIVEPYIAKYILLQLKELVKLHEKKEGKIGFEIVKPQPKKSKLNYIG